MVNALVSQVEQPNTYEGLPFEERLQLLADSKYQDRENRKQQRLLKAAKLKLAANSNGIDYQHPRGLNQSMMASLLHCDWLKKAQNILITGPCGSGKTYIACAVGHTACMKGYSVKYYRLSRLMLDCLIIDDWGLEPLKAAQRNDLMEIMDDRNEIASTIMISQLPTDQWYQSIGDNTLVDAILDRLIHNAHRIKLKGESLRKTQSNLTDGEHLEVK